MARYLDDTRVALVEKFVAAAIRSDEKLTAAGNAVGKALRGETIDPAEMAALNKALDVPEKPAIHLKPLLDSK